MAGMSKRHFEGLARAISEGLDNARNGASPTGAVQDVAEGIADLCRKENPQFERRRFLAACGLSREG